MLVGASADDETAIATSMNVGASRLLRTKTTRLLDAKDIGAALGLSIEYESPAACELFPN